MKCVADWCPFPDETDMNDCSWTDGCDYYRSPPTNADRIRSMSDEELAEFLDDTQKRECEALHMLNEDGSLKFISMRGGWLLWLRQPTDTTK